MLHNLKVISVFSPVVLVTFCLFFYELNIKTTSSVATSSLDSVFLVTVAFMASIYLIIKANLVHIPKKNSAKSKNDVFVSKNTVPSEGRKEVDSILGDKIHYEEIKDDVLILENIVHYEEIKEFDSILEGKVNLKEIKEDVVVIENTVNLEKTKEFDSNLLDEVLPKEKFSIQEDYHAAFLIILAKFSYKISFKEMLRIMEETFTATSPFIGTKYKFYFKAGVLYKVSIKNNKKLKSPKISTLEHRYSTLQFLYLIG